MLRIARAAILGSAAFKTTGLVRARFPNYRIKFILYWGTLSQGIHISNHHIVHFKCIIILFVKFTSINLEKIDNKNQHFKANIPFMWNIVKTYVQS